ncbi:putative ABC transporter permease protein [Blautia sp. CAG:37]|nr:putative ABC transporter permease protein [Blautia sp. CAG:37]
MRAFRKDFIREITKNKGRFLSVFFIVLLGAAFFSGIRSAEGDMKVSADRYYDEVNYMDLKVLGTLGLTDDDLADIAKTDGVKAVYGGKTVEVLHDIGESEQVVKLIALTDSVNEPRVVKGRMPEKEDEILVDTQFLKSSGCEIGDQVTFTSGTEDPLSDSLTGDTFTIVGSATLPYYMDLNRGTGSIGNGSINSFALLLPEAFTSDLYTEIYVQADGAQEEASYSDAYDETVKAVQTKIEALEDAACDRRYTAVKTEGQEKIDDAKQQVVDAEQKLADAKTELDDGAQQLADAKVTIADKEQELLDGEQTLKDKEQELLDGKQTIAEKEQELLDGKQAIAEKEQELLSAKATIADKEQELVSGKATLKDKEAELASGKATLEAKAAELESGKATLSQKAAELESGKTTLNQKAAELESGKAALEAKAKELSDGKTQLAAKETELASGKTELEEKMAQLSAAKTELSQKQTELNAAKEQLSVKETELNAAKEQLSAAREELESKKEETAAGRAQYEAQKAAYEEQKNQYETAKDQLAQLGGQLSDVEAAQTEVAGQIEAITAQLDGLTEEDEVYASLLEQKTALEAKQTELAQQLSTMHEQKTFLEQNIAAFEAASAEAEAQLVAAEAQITDAENQLAAADAQLTEKEQECAAGEDELAAAKEELENGEAQVTAGLAQIADGEAQASAYQKQLEDGEAQLNAAKAQIEEGEAQIEANRSKLEEGEAQLAAARAQIADGEQQIASYQQTIQSGEAQLAEGRKTIADGESQLADAKQTISNGESQIAEAKQSIADGETQLAEAKQTIADGESQLAEAKQTIADGETQLADAKQEIADGKISLADAKQEIADKEKELEDGKAEYEKAKADAEPEIVDAKQEIADGEKTLADLKKPTWYVWGRDKVTSTESFGQDAGRISNIGKFFPVIFFLVAALVSLTTMTRMIEEQRQQIGTLKALGYSDGVIAFKYFAYAMLSTVSGALAGVVVGEKILPWVIMNAYGMLYTGLPYYMTPLNWEQGGLAILASAACTGVATIAACYKELAAGPAELMRPEAPKNGKRIFLERIGVLWKHLNFTQKSTVRNLVRYKKRFFMTVIGIGGCMGLILVGFGLQDSITAIAKNQFVSLFTYQANAVLNSDVDESEKEALQTDLENYSGIDELLEMYCQNIELQTDKKTVDAVLEVPKELTNFNDFYAFRDRKSGEVYEFPTDGGAAISEKTATMLGVKAGDTVQLKKGDDIVDVKISIIVENYVRHYLYLAPDLYEELFGGAPDYNQLLMKYQDMSGNYETALGEKIMTYDGVAAISFTSDLIDQIDNMLRSLDIVIVVLIVSAGLLAFVVLYNLNNINITERQRELATLKVLGFFDGEVASYVYRENMVLTLFGVIAGMGIGTFLHHCVIQTVEVDMMMFGRNVFPRSYGWSALITLAFALFVNFMMFYRLRKIDMIESLKSVE